MPQPTFSVLPGKHALGNSSIPMFPGLLLPPASQELQLWDRPPPRLPTPPHPWQGCWRGYRDVLIMKSHAQSTRYKGQLEWAGWLGLEQGLEPDRSEEQEGCCWAWSACTGWGGGTGASGQCPHLDANSGFPTSAQGIDSLLQNGQTLCGFQAETRGTCCCFFIKAQAYG